MVEKDLICRVLKMNGLGLKNPHGRKKWRLIMRRKHGLLSGIIPFVALPLLLGGCSETGLEPENPLHEEPLPDPYPFEEAEPVITPNQATLVVGQSLKLQREWQDGDDNYEDLSRAIHWRSDNPRVARVDQEGFVVALSEGAAIITASTKDGAGRARITVIAQ
jgi:hypothetical protein